MKLFMNSFTAYIATQYGLCLERSMGGRLLPEGPMICRFPPIVVDSADNPSRIPPLWSTVLSMPFVFRVGLAIVAGISYSISSTD